MTTLAEFKAMRDEYTKKIATEGKGVIATEFQAVFEKHPELKAIGWTQYTPYFNDGDPCKFGVREFNFTVADVDAKKVKSLYDEPWTEAYGVNKGAISDAVASLSRGLPRDVMEAAFGDHVQVIATRDGFHVTEYEHD